MKKGLIVTLLAVAIAAIGAQASAMAPVIKTVKSPVIADDTPISGGNHFVYPDALNLDTLATDDTVQPSAIIWSYTGTGRYMINGQAPLNLASDDPVNPGATKRIDNADNDPDKVDANARTITFRDKTLSPIAGPDVNPGTTGIVHSEVVTMFASDGTTYSDKSFLVYTRKGGFDSLTGTVITPAAEKKWQFTNGTDGSDWTPFTMLGTAVTTRNASGLCIQVPDAGDNWGGWLSPYGQVKIAKNKVYRFRMNVDSTAPLAVGKTPFWSVVVDNFNTANAAQRDGRFNGEFMFIDKEGGANAAGVPTNNGVGRQNFLAVWAPVAVNSANWNDPTNGVFTPARESANVNGMRFEYRIIDVSGPNGGQNQGGTLCLKSLDIDSLDISELVASSTAVDAQNITAAGFSTRTIFTNSTLVTYAGGDVTIAPNTAGALGQDAWDVEVIALDFGDTVVDLGNPATVADNYPIPWVSDQLLKFSYGVTAPTATDAANPPDAIALIADTATIEHIGLNTVIFGKDFIGAPKNGVVTDYVTFFYSHNATKSATTGLNRIRSVFQILNNTAINAGTTNVNNTGAVTVTYAKVEVVDNP